MQVIIMRGITGSGKSSIVRRLFKTATICSADLYFADRKMDWNPRYLAVAHEECYESFLDAMDAQTPVIVIDNNNLKIRDYADYVEDALDHGYVVTFFHVMCSPEAAAIRSKHAKSIAEQGLKHMWKHHHHASETPSFVNDETVDSTEVWTSEKPGLEPVWPVKEREESRTLAPQPLPAPSRIQG